MTALTPLLKNKVDELFLHWFSEINTQTQLRKDLAHICGTNDTPRPCSPPDGLSSISGLNINTRPSSPPIPPGSPTTTPRSPRRRTSSNLSRRSSKRSFRLSQKEEKHEKLFPGCAKDLKQFYFPYGEPAVVNTNEDIVKSVKRIFETFPKNVALLKDFGVISKVGLFIL